MPKRKASRSQRVNRSKKPQICHLDSLSKETLDMVLAHLKPPVSTRRFEVMERGLPRNDLHETKQWHTIALGIAALACLARTAHRYHAAVIPHLYQNLVMPSHAYGRRGWELPDPKVLSKLEYRFGLDRVRWPMEALCRAGVAGPNAAWHHLLKNITLSRPVWRHWTVRLDLRHVYWTSSLVTVLKTMPNLEELAMMTYRGEDSTEPRFEGRQFGRVLRSLKRLKGLAIRFADEYWDVLLAVAFIKVELDWLALTCNWLENHDHAHRGDKDWQSFEPENGLAVRYLSIDCPCPHSAEQLLWMVHPPSVQALRIARPTNPGTSLLPWEAFSHAAAHVRSLEVSLCAKEDMDDIAELLPELECLDILWLPMPKPVHAFYHFMACLPERIHTLRFPCAQPYMLPCLADILGEVDVASIKRLEVGIESMQFTASHWLPEYKARIPWALAALDTVCREMEIVLVVNSSIWGQASEWSTWIAQPPSVCDFGADGDRIKSFARSLQPELWKAWSAFPRQGKDKPFLAILRRYKRRNRGEHFLIREWEDERRLLWEHEVHGDEDDEDTSDESESGEEDDGGEEADRSGDDGTRG